MPDRTCSIDGCDRADRIIRGRVKPIHGPASDHDCVDCGQQARDWSYDNADLNEKHDKSGPYSPDPDHYQPRCKSCHRRFDNNARRAA